MAAGNKNSHNKTNPIKKRTLVLVTTTVLVACLAVIGATTVSAQSEVVSEFDNGPEGWTATGDTQTGSVAWQATGGNPGGHVVADDSVAGGVWYWNASEDFLGDKSGFLDETLEYDLNVSSTDSQFNAKDVILEGGGTTLEYDHGDQSTHPGTDWTEYEVVLNASDDGWENETGDTPTRSEFDSVLSSLSSLEIRGEYKSGPDTGRLDNVVLSAEDTGGSINDVQVTLSDEDGDGLDDSITVDVSVDGDEGVTVVEFDAPFSLDLSETETNQGSLVSINDGQQKENVTFGSTGFTGTYTVKGDLSGQSVGETGNVTAWIGDVSEGSASDTDETDFTVKDGISPPSSVDIQAPSGVPPGSTFDVDVPVVSDGGVTVVEFDAPFSLDLSGTDENQADIVSINDGQQKENVTFGSTGFTGTYTVTVGIGGGTDGDTVGISSWVGDLDRSNADAEATDSVAVSAGTPNPFLEQDGDPLGEIAVVQRLTDWADNKRINGQSYGEIELIGFLTEWNDARE